ncbi:MAG: outer membrane lipoprotein carrier protein LolA [Desulfuromonadales bacterium]|nr:outer membrane lipoprotein carrier protein LolA [Desulfuromonadales bacterium]
MRRFLWLPLLLCLAAPLGASGPSATPEVDAVLTHLRQMSSGLQTLQSDFVQEKHLSVFQEVLTSRGRFLFARPDKLRWELTEPVAAGFVLSGDQGRRWHARSGRSEPFDLEREPVMKLVAEQLIAWAGADFQRLRQQYRIQVVTAEPVVLRLEPKGAAAGFLDHLRVAFAPGGRHVAAVEIHEKDGDSTRIRFENGRINALLPEDAF